MLDKDAVNAVMKYGKAEYNRGLSDGLAVAEKIRDWLATIQPPRKWANEVAGWATKEIDATRERNGSGG